MELNDTVVIPAMKWHSICHELSFDDVDRKGQFETRFNCKVQWKSGVNALDSDAWHPTNPVMVLRFVDPKDATIFGLTWAC